jgi:tetratricopeptide (TPR) repeat protein
MKHLLIILCIILATELNAQQQKIVDMYTPINVDFYKRIMDQTSATITERTNNVKTMMSWIIDLKSATSESKVNQELDLFYKKLDKCLHWDDISELSITKLSEIELGIKKAIAAYNSRIAEYNSKIAKDNDPQTIINNGIAKFKNNDLDGALTDFKTAEKLAPDFSGSYHLQGVIYYYKMQYAFAISAFTKAIDRDQNNKTSYELRGWSYNYSKKFLLALPDFNKIITMNSNDESGYFGRGYAKDNLGDIRGAIKDYEQTISLNPNNSMAFNNLGWSYFESGDSKKALEYVNKAISLDQWIIR